MAKFAKSFALAAALALPAAQPALAEKAHHESPPTAGQAAPQQTPLPATTGAHPSQAMPQGGMPMMMMNMMQGGAGGMCDMMMPGKEMADRIEGRIAFLRAELRITDAQAEPWNAFAAALRDNAKALAAARAAAPPDAGSKVVPAIRELQQQERWYAARLQGIRTISATLQPLYAVFTDAQKKAADELIGPHLGLKRMGMGPMGMMGGGPMGMMGG